MKKKKILKAKVISNKMQKSIVVKIERLVKHKLYKKYIKKSMKLHVHDENNIANYGDIINICECRPYSKTKSWKLVKIIKKNIIN